MRSFTKMLLKLWTWIMVIQYGLAFFSLLGFIGNNLWFIGNSGIGLVGHTNLRSFNNQARHLLMVNDVSLDTITPKVREIELVCYDHEHALCDNDREELLTAFLLAILLGGLGIARCYTGYVCCGIVQGFTCGGCGIWWLIDWILLLSHGWCRSENGCSFVNW